MFQRHTWVCSLCGQGLTRKSSANRHNSNLHSGQAGIVRPFEYIIGRLNGTFSTPSDPLTYRHKNENSVFNQDLNGNNNDFMSKVVADNTQELPKTNYNNYNAFPKPSIQPILKTADNRPPSSVDIEKMLEERLKLEEFNVLLNKHYHPDNARQILALATSLLFIHGGVEFLDKKLEWLRKLDKVRFGSSQMTTPPLFPFPLHFGSSQMTTPPLFPFG